MPMILVGRSGDVVAGLEQVLFGAPSTLRLGRAGAFRNEKLLRGDIAVFPCDCLNIAPDSVGQLAVIAI